jgi:hypothetical protein
VIWADAASDVTIDFPADWRVAAGGTLVEGQLVQAAHLPTGGGLAVRVDPISDWVLPDRVRERIGDVDAAASADRWAQALAASQTDGSADRTVYLGLSDVAGARVGRWVFTEPAHDGEPARVWWHAVWRSETHWAQVVAWVPEDRFPAFLPAMRELETRLGTSWTAPAALLFRAEAGCDGPASVDRMAAVASSRRFAAARQKGATGLDELRQIGGLLAITEACTKDVAKEVRACTLHDRVSDTDRSKRAQQALVTCIDR